MERDLKLDDKSDMRVEDVSLDEHSRDWTPEEEAKARRRLDFRIVPIVAILYLLCFLDRSAP
jgi:hypothetical protein